MKFNGLILTDKIGSSPAAVHLRSGVLHINPKIFFAYPKEWQKFIVLHEMGHWILQTRSEEKADDFAFHHFIESGESLKDAVESLLRVLDKNDDGHRKRIEALLDKAKFFDREVYGKEFKTPKERKEAMSDYLQTEHTALAYCLGKNDCKSAKTHMANILVVVDPSQEEKVLDKFATLLADMQMQRYNGQYIGDMAYFLCFGNNECQARKKLKAQAKAELIKCKNSCKKNATDAEPLQKYKGEEVVSTAGAAAGAVANLIIPGSGPLVNKIVSGGGKIVSGIVGFFQRKKAEGKTDQQILNDPEYLAQKAQAEAELEQLYIDGANFQAKYQQYLGAFTDADRTFSTMRKAAKFKQAVLPAAGRIDGDTFSYGGYTLKLSQLNVFKPVFGLGEGVAMPVYETTPVTPKTAATGLPDPAAGEAEQPKKKSKAGLILGIVAAIIIIAAVVAFIMLRKKK